MLASEKIGLGCWGLGGDAYGNISVSKAIELLQFSYDSGIRFYDLSNLYGAGRAEVIFGEWFSKYREITDHQIEIVSKAGLLPHTGFDMPTDFGLDSLRTEIKRSCIRIGVANLPIFLLHSPTGQQMLGLNFSQISKTLKSENLIEQFGVSVRAPSDLEGVSFEFIDWVELNFNLMDMRFLVNGKLLALLKKNNVRIIARTPLAFGFLTSQGMADQDIQKPTSHLRNWSVEQIAVWRGGAEKFKEYASGIGLSIEELALSFCASIAEVDRVIPGAMKPDHINLNYSNTVQLPQTVINDLRQIYRENNFYVQKK